MAQIKRVEYCTTRLPVYRRPEEICFCIVSITSAASTTVRRRRPRDRSTAPVLPYVNRSRVRRLWVRASAGVRHQLPRCVVIMVGWWYDVGNCDGLLNFPSRWRLIKATTPSCCVNGLFVVYSAASRLLEDSYSFYVGIFFKYLL